MYIPFEGANIVLPFDEGVPAYLDQESGIPFAVMCIKPNKEDIDAIMRGEPMYVRIEGPVMVPVRIYTFDQNNNVNI